MVTYPQGISPLHLQDLPDGLPSLSAVYLEPPIRELSETPAHTRADPVRAEPQIPKLTAQRTISCLP
jgi:hypothetical protein